MTTRSSNKRQMSGDDQLAMKLGHSVAALTAERLGTTVALREMSCQ
jgi:hypothetical protein